VDEEGQTITHPVWLMDPEISRSQWKSDGTVQPFGRILHFEVNDDWDCAVGEASRAYGGVLKQFRRHVVFLKPSCVLLYDEVEGEDPGEPHRYDLLFHSLGDMARHADGVTITLQRANLRVFVLQLKEIEIELRSTPRAQDGREHAFALIHPRERGQSVSFVTLLVPFRKGESPISPTVTLREGPMKILSVSLRGRDLHIMLR
jgi:hypothetical protein